MKGILLAGLMIFSLAGCGGGGGGSDSSETAITGASPAAGTYEGTADNGRLDLGFVILQSGEFFGLYDDGTNSTGFLYGKGTTTNSTFSVSGTDYGIDGDHHSFTLSSTYRSGLSLSGNVSEDGQTTSLTTTYTAEQPLPPAALAGTYTGSYLNYTGAGIATVTIDLVGNVSTVDSNNCHTTGIATQATGVTGIYEISLTYENNSALCGAEFANKSVSGILFMNNTTSELNALLVSSNGAIAVIYVGTK